MSDYPFRYYGSDPADWVEGANAGHVFSVQFERVPSDDELRRLGRAYAEALRQGRAQPVGHEVAGRFLRLLVGERGKSMSHGEHIGPLTRFFRAAHRIVPIRDAVYENAREGVDAWSRWSLEQGPPDPGPGPATPKFALYRRERDPGLPELAASPAFARGEAEAHDAQYRATIERELARHVDDPVRLVAVTDELAPPRCWTDEDFAGFELGATALRDADGHDLVGRDRNWARVDAGDYPLIRSGVVRLARVIGDVAPIDVAWIDDAGRRRVAGLEALKLFPQVVALRPDGGEAAVAGGAKLATVDLHGGEVRELPPLEDAHVRALAYLGDGSRLAVSTSRGVMLLDLRAQPAAVVDHSEADHRELHAVAEGQALLARKREGYGIYAFAQDRLERIAATPVDLPFWFERDGRVLFGREGLSFELVGLGPALEQAQRAKPKPKPKREPKPRRGKPPAVELVAVAQPPAALLERLSFEPSKREKQNSKAKLAELPDGSYAIAKPSGKHRRNLAHVDASGKQTSLTSVIGPHVNETILGVYLPPSGRFMLVWTHGRLVRVDLSAPHSVETVAESDLYTKLRNPQMPADDLVVYVDGKQVRWVRRGADGTWTEVAAGKVPDATWVLAASESVAIVYAKDDLKRAKPKYPLRVWTLGPKRAKEVGKFERLAMRAASYEGRWYIRDHPGDVFELAGLE